MGGGVAWTLSVYSAHALCFLRFFPKTSEIGLSFGERGRLSIGSLVGERCHEEETETTRSRKGGRNILLRTLPGCVRLMDGLGVGARTRRGSSDGERDIGLMGQKGLSVQCFWLKGSPSVGRHGAAGKRFLRLISFYNISGRSTGYVKSQKERLLSKVLAQAASLGDQPVLICSDTNCTVENSAALKSALASSKWYDLGDYFSNHKPANTFCAKEPWDESQATRPDYVLANAPALSLCRNFEVTRTLEVTLDFLVTLSFDSAPSRDRCLKPLQSLSSS